MKKYQLFLTLFLISAAQHLHAQDYYDNKYSSNVAVFEVGISVGAMNAFTDLGGTKGKGGNDIQDFNFKNTRPCGSVYVSAVYRNKVVIRLEGTFGSVKAYDSILKNVASSTNGRYERNLSFRSSIYEASIAAEFYVYGNYYDEDYPIHFSPYILGGIGLYHFNPQTLLNKSWINLQPLRTEGQGFAEYPDKKVYKLTQINFPLGAGVRYDVSSSLTLRAELVYRLLLTDYLDDVSTKYIEPAVFPNYLSGQKLAQALLLNDRHKPGAVTAHPNGIRGNPDNKDGYLSFNIKLGITIGEVPYRNY